MDHACKFDSYMLNREAKQLEHLLTLVDGSHWNSQKKLKHPNSKKGGHLGCSEESVPNSKRRRNSQQKFHSKNKQYWVVGEGVGEGGRLGGIVKNVSKFFSFLNLENFSQGYNWNLYKSTYAKEEAVNSQGREQMHAILENLSKSLRLMNNQHFMLFLYVFFATTNLHNRGYK